MEKKKIYIVAAIVVLTMIITYFLVSGEKKERVVKNEQGEILEKVIVDKNIETELVNITEEEGKFGVVKFSYNIENVTDSRINYKMKNSAFVDYRVYDETEEGEYEPYFQYTETYPPAEGIFNLSIDAGDTDERVFELGDIPEGNYKIEFWLNLENGKEVNRETAYFSIK